MSEPDNTGDKQAVSQFKPGQSGNPKGRPKGARSKLGEEFLQSLADDFQEHGVETIQKVRVRSPEVYLKIVKDILPREAVLMAFNIHKDMNEVDPFENASIESILATVAMEAGEDAAVTLASMFKVEYSPQKATEVKPQRTSDYSVSDYRNGRITRDEMIARGMTAKLSIIWMVRRDE